MIKKGFFPLQMFDFNKHMGFGIFLIDDLWNFLPVNKKKKHTHKFGYKANKERKIKREIKLWSFNFAFSFISSSSILYLRSPALSLFISGSLNPLENIQRTSIWSL